MKCIRESSATAKIKQMARNAKALGYSLHKCGLFTDPAERKTFVDEYHRYDPKRRQKA